ncbi:MAG: hypothetical protein HC880_18015 [Bacteroidia bacterium]|nr:hypothetical protein [Bacteroidia bacterium]
MPGPDAGPMTANLLQVQGQHPSDEWHLKINSQEIRFTLANQIFSYPYNEPRVVQDSSSETVKVYRSQNTKTNIVVLVIENSLTHTRKTIVEHQHQWYTSNSSF